MIKNINDITHIDMESVFIMHAHCSSLFQKELLMTLRTVHQMFLWNVYWITRHWCFVCLLWFFCCCFVLLKDSPTVQWKQMSSEKLPLYSLRIFTLDLDSLFWECSRLSGTSETPGRCFKIYWLIRGQCSPCLTWHKGKCHCWGSTGLQSFWLEKE